jgi:hypothetical protein
VVGGSILMALGAVAIALSSATDREHLRWQEAAERESKRYGVEGAYVRAAMEGKEFQQTPSRRSLLDWLLVCGVTAVFVALAAMTRLPRVDIDLRWAATVSVAMLLLLVGCGIALWRITRFS